MTVSGASISELRRPRLVALAAGTMLGVDPLVAVESAVEAGFDAIGLRPDLEDWTASDTRSVAAALRQTGLEIMDIEVARIGVHPIDHSRRLIELGSELGARHLLVVSDDPDRPRAAAEFAELSRSAAEAGMRAVLEFMRFTAVQTLEDAVDVIIRSGSSGGVLVDALHLTRSGGRASEVAKIDPALLSYAQLCDAPMAPAADLAYEARHARIVPGRGELPLRELVAALPADLPVSLEVQSDDERQSRTPQEWARVVRRAAGAVLDTSQNEQRDR